MHPSLFLILLGVAMSVVSWIWFRHPGQRFWFAGPVWQASKYLNPNGAKLWVTGSIMSLIGILWLSGSLLAS